jgi:hypothetical protein
MKVRDRPGRVDGFDQAGRAGQGDEGGVVFRGLPAAERDALEALGLTDSLPDAGAALVGALGD